MAGFSGQGAEGGAAGGAAIGASYGGPFGALAGGILGALGGGFLGAGSPIQYSPQATQLAALSNQQFQTAANASYGLENQLISYAEDPNQVALARQGALTGSAAQVGAAQAATGRQLAGEGIRLTPEQQMAQTRSGQVSGAATEAGAANAAATGAFQTQQGILQGAAG